MSIRLVIQRIASKRKPQTILRVVSRWKRVFSTHKRDIDDSYNVIPGDLGAPKISPLVENHDRFRQPNSSPNLEAIPTPVIVRYVITDRFG